MVFHYTYELYYSAMQALLLLGSNFLHGIVKINIVFDLTIIQLVKCLITVFLCYTVAQS